MNAAHPSSASVCILTYNRCSWLRSLLSELSTIASVPLEILVIDNHSQDGTQSMVAADFPQITYLRMEENIGAGARNIAMQAARNEIIITLDDDISGLTDRAVALLLDKFRSDASLGAVNFCVTDPDGRVCNWVHHCEEEKFHDKEFPTYEITEGAVAFRKSALLRSGYYPEKFFLSHEGPDLAFRLLDAGFKVIYFGSVRVKHYFASESREPWRNYYYDTRNQLWLAARNFPFTYALAYLGRGLSSMLVYSIRDGYFRYWAKAMLDGVLGLKEAMRGRRVLSNSTMKILRRIDSQRPSFTYMVRKRILNKGAVNLK
jgi:GT2 family glycosyltransferase